MIYCSIKGEKVPALGFGTWRLQGQEALDAVRCALELGYRHIDTAIRYDNEAEVGQALAESGIGRSDIFLTTKLPHSNLARDDVKRQTLESLDRLRTDYVDLLLVHWPNRNIPLTETMQALAEVQAEGRARHIGVSNFPTRLMREAADASDAEIFANQVEYHPYLSQEAVLGYARSNDIMLMAAVPLARGAVDREPVIQTIAERHGKTPAQITLRWLIQQKNVTAVPKSAQADRIRSNFEIFDFALTDAEMNAIFGLAANMRLVNPDWAPEWDAA